MKSKYKCRVSSENDDILNASTQNICIDNVNNRYKAEECAIMNGYGREQCVNTIYAQTNTPCVYDDKTQLCMNNDDDKIPAIGSETTDTGQNTPGIAAGNDSVKCLNIYNSDSSKMADNCNEQPNCEWLSDSEMCVPASTVANFGSETTTLSDLNRNKVCLSLSNTVSNFNNLANDGPTKTYISDDDNKANCRSFQQNGYNVLTYGRDIGDVTCDMLDQINNYTSATMLNTVIHNTEIQEGLCSSLRTSGGVPLCAYYKDSRPIEQSLDTKHKQISKCMTLSDAERLTDGRQLYAVYRKNSSPHQCSGDDYIWSERNNLCVNAGEQCNNIKHENICKTHNQCIWQSLGENTRDNEAFDRGFCRDLNHDLNDLENKMDEIHYKHIENAVQISDLERRLVKMMPDIKNSISNINS